MEFKVVSRGFTKKEKNTAFLIIDNWDDFSFETTFALVVFDEQGDQKNIGIVKIGFKNQKERSRTRKSMPNSFQQLGEEFFSLGQELDYYQNIRRELTKERGDEVLQGLNDIVLSPEAYKLAENEHVFGSSLLRSVSLATIKGQFKRLLDGGVPLTDFNFRYIKPQTDEYSGIELKFEIEPDSKPSTNIHALIGRNGAGKTMLLNDMIASIINYAPDTTGTFFDTRSRRESQISEDYFSRLVSVSFSAFDAFNPPHEQSDPSLGTCYYYVGLKKIEGDSGKSELKTLDELRKEFSKSLALCLSQSGKKSRWLKAISTLESDENFAEIGLEKLTETPGAKREKAAYSLISRMSSGHALVLLSITRLVETVEEKTLVLIDEPESHLHPPLLSAFIRALSELLFDRNGVAIIATHSPVVLQEVPRSCVWKITRSGLALSTSRPEIETFGENVGILTREVFGLEVAKSGFHSLLEESVAQGKLFDEIMDEYEDQLGFEAQAVLRAMLAHRDKNKNH